MAHAIGMLVGAFLILYLFYSFWFSDDEPLSWKTLHRPLMWIWRDTYVHSPASLRRLKPKLKVNALLVVLGLIMGWGMTDSILQTFGY
jgi:hypothetical protein